MAGIDSNAKLVLHCDGIDGSTSFPDASNSAHSPTAGGNAEVDTAQSVFGGASGLLDGAGDYISVPDSADWDFSNNDMAFDFRVRFNSVSGNQCFIGRPTSGSSYFYFAYEGGGIRCRDFPGGFDVNFGAIWTPVINTWYHIALTRDGNNWRFFVDGVQKGSTIVNSGLFLSRSITLQVGANSAISYYVNGWMDEVRISNGDSRWTANFTPPTEAYSEDIVDITDNLQISDSILVTDTIIQESDSFLISDNIVVTDTTVQESESLQILDSIIVTSTNTDAKFISKIISVNPLIFITDTDPIEIIKVDTTDPQNITWIVQTVPGISSAKDVAVNTTNDFIYIAGENGQVIKVEIADLSNQTIIDVNDTDHLITIETNSNFGLTYAGTDNAIGELYVIDERLTYKLDSDFRVLHPAEFLIESDFNIVKAFKMDSDFQVLEEATFQIATDFKCISIVVPVVFPPPPTDPSPPPPPTPIVMEDTEIPINLEDYQVFIDGIELSDTDLILNSISITHTFGQESKASFRLTRKHDQLNTTLEGNIVNITNQNTVVIKCKGITIFPQGSGTGNISEIDARYNNNEFVVVNALAPEATNQFNNITMSLPSLNKRLSIYDILIQNPKIFNPIPDPQNEENPSQFKGIRVNLGKRIQQRINIFGVSDAFGSIADKIQKGTFNPIYNWTYFWSPTVTKFGIVNLGETIARTFFYIGTSLSPVSEDLWNLDRATHRRQRIYDDKEEELGFYEVGEAPFKEISVRNGEKITKFKLVDEDDMLSSIKQAGYNFIEFAKTVANLEFQKLKNINEDILPKVSYDLTMTIDAYLYYSISLLTKINVDNTTQTNIYNNTNGFPVSTKTITITSANRKVTVQADNIKSVKELEELDDKFPNEDDDEYNSPAQNVVIAIKTNMRTRLNVD